MQNFDAFCSSSKGSKLCFKLRVRSPVDLDLKTTQFCVGHLNPWHAGKGITFFLYTVKFLVSLLSSTSAYLLESYHTLLSCSLVDGNDSTAERKLLNMESQRHANFCTIQNTFFCSLPQYKLADVHSYVCP